MALITLRQAVLYFRVSGRDQADNFSLRSQEEDCRDYTKHEGANVKKTFTDVGSGLSTKQRPQFVEMCAYALDKKNGITDVVFWDLDRFTRNIRQFFEYTDQLVKAGITLHLALEGEKYDYNSEEKWHQRLIAGEGESKRTSKRTKRGQHKATALGFHIGPPPWGYMLVYDSDEVNEKGERIVCGRLEPDPDTWPHCLTFWSMAVNGSTPMQVTRYMNQHNIPSPSGGLWTDGTARSTMKNEKYCGRLFRGKHPESRLPGPKDDAKMTVVEDNHKAAVSPDDFERVNEMIRSRHRSQGPTRCHSSPNSLSGLLKCGECKTEQEIHNLEINRQNGKVYLRCSRKKKLGRDACSFKGGRLDRVLEAVTDKLTNHFLTEATLESVIAGVAEESREYLEKQETDKSGIRARLNVVRNGIKNINDVLTEQGTKAENYKSLIASLGALEMEWDELEQAAERIAEVSEKARLFVTDKDGIIETAMDLKTYAEPADPEAIRELFHIFIDKVEVFNEDYGFIYYRLPVRRALSEDTPAKEIIYFEKKKDSMAREVCGLDGCTGIDRFQSSSGQTDPRFPRRRGDRPSIDLTGDERMEVPPQARG